MKGTFKPKHLEKYKGDPTNIVWRSWWEFTVMSRFDNNPNVIEWSSEEVIIPYRTLLDEQYEIKNKLPYRRYHRYFVDFYVKVKDRSGKVNKYLIEVKPLKETKAPQRAEFRTEPSYQKAMRTWVINSAKWKAAREYCADRGMGFLIQTEEDIYGRPEHKPTKPIKPKATSKHRTGRSSRSDGLVQGKASRPRARK